MDQQAKTVGETHDRLITTAERIPGDHPALEPRANSGELFPAAVGNTNLSSHRRQLNTRLLGLILNAVSGFSITAGD